MDSLSELRRITDIKLALFRLLSALFTRKDALRAVLRPRSRLRACLPENQFLMEAMLDLRQQAGALHDSQKAGCCNRVIQALRRYPLPLRHPLQALHMKGVGNNMINKFYKIFKARGVPFTTVRWPDKAKRKPVVKVARTIREHEKSFRKEGVDIDEEAEKVNESIGRTTRLGILQHPDLTWALILVADNREREDLPLDLEDAVLESRTLAIGDFVWVVRLEYQHQGCLIRKEEYLMDYLIERKTTKDLAASSFSTHLNDQLSRMRKCSQMRSFLLLEGDLTGREQALSLQTNHKLGILQCRNRGEMLAWLQLLSKEVLAKARTLSFHQLREKLTFDEFTTSFRKTVSLHEIFTEQVRQWKGIAPAKVPEVLKVFPVFSHLSREYRDNTEETITKLRRLGLSHETVEFVGNLVLGHC